MKKILLIIVASMILTYSCKKENDDYINDGSEAVKEVPFTLEISLNSSKSDFTNILPFGKINWGNENKIEYLYLGANDNRAYVTQYTQGTIFVGELVELQAEVTNSTDKLVFSGMISQNLLYDGETCSIYYFGNNGNALEGSNVTNIYDRYYTNCLIGKTVSFAKQTGDVNDVGDFHVAAISARSKFIYDADRNVLGVNIVAEPLENKMSLALLDLKGENTLSGDAAAIQSCTMKWVESDRAFKFFYEYVDGGTIDVTGNVGEKSLIAVLPSKNAVTLECSKGHYTFEDGIDINQVYIGKMGHNLDEATPLPWRQ